MERELDFEAATQLEVQVRWWSPLDAADTIEQTI